MANEVSLEGIKLAYVYLDKVDENGKFRSTILLDKKTQKDQINMVWDAIDAAIDQGIKEKTGWKGKAPRKSEIRFTDGDEGDIKDFWGYMVLTAKNQNPVPMVLQNPDKEAFCPKDIYSGVIANAVINVYPYDTKNNGIAYSLEAIQKVEDGERMSGSGVDPKKAFKKIAGSDRDDDRGRGRDDRDDDRRGSSRGRDEEPAHRSRSRDDDRDDDRGRGRDDDRRGSRDRDDRDPEPRSRGGRDDRDDDRGRGHDRDDDRGSRSRRDDDEPAPRGRGRDDRDEPEPRSRRDSKDDDDYDRGRDRGRSKF